MQHVHVIRAWSGAGPVPECRYLEVSADIAEGGEVTLATCNGHHDAVTSAPGYEIDLGRGQAGHLGGALMAPGPVPSGSAAWSVQRVRRYPSRGRAIEHPLVRTITARTAGRHMLLELIAEGGTPLLTLELTRDAARWLGGELESAALRA